MTYEAGGKANAIIQYAMKEPAASHAGGNGFKLFSAEIIYSLDFLVLLHQGKQDKPTRLGRVKMCNKYKIDFFSKPYIWDLAQ